MAMAIVKDACEHNEDEITLVIEGDSMDELLSPAAKTLASRTAERLGNYGLSDIGPPYPSSFDGYGDGIVQELPAVAEGSKYRTRAKMIRRI